MGQKTQNEIVRKLSYGLQHAVVFLGLIRVVGPVISFAGLPFLGRSFVKGLEYIFRLIDNGSRQPLGKGVEVGLLRLSFLILPRSFQPLAGPLF